MRTLSGDAVHITHGVSKVHLQVGTCSLPVSNTAHSSFDVFPKLTVKLVSQVAACMQVLSPLHPFCLIQKQAEQ